MHFTDLPNDVLLQITRLLSVKSTFDLAITCKQVYERILHLPLTGTFTLDHRKKNLNITAAHAAKLLYCIPVSEHIFLRISNNPSASVGEALYQSGRMDVTILNQQNTRRKRTPSPIRETERSVKKMKEWWLNQSVDEDISNLVPQALINENLISSGSHYEHFQNDSHSGSNVICSSDVDRVISERLASLFIKSLLEFDFAYVLVTQFEVYYRNDQKIDASATSTHDDQYYEMPVGEVKNKTERGKVWFELSIFYKRYELLATGEVFFMRNDQDRLSFSLGQAFLFQTLRLRMPDALFTYTSI